MCKDYKNELDYDGLCARRGRDAEFFFAYLATGKGWTVIKPENDIGKREHWDRSITKNDKTYLVEVKAVKCLSRRFYPVLQDDWLWIEISGVGKYNHGWLYGGLSDFIAFEIKKGFLIVKRLDLLDFVEKTVNFDLFTDSPEKAKYICYSRTKPDRFDIITLIERSALEPLKSNILNE